MYQAIDMQLLVNVDLSLGFPTDTVVIEFGVKIAMIPGRASNQYTGDHLNDKC